ncbi:hypothetical protein [Ancylobacter oerskovii]|uniref:magnesium chelatase subunit ChlI family protein n=1 Tax=Ancylobacter oerskovii TaxID=459519 RepID=UPI003CCEE98D
MPADAARIIRLSARGYHRVLQVARTLADLAGAETVGRPPCRRGARLSRRCRPNERGSVTRGASRPPEAAGTLIEEIASPDTGGAALPADAARIMRPSARGYHRGAATLGRVVRGSEVRTPPRFLAKDPFGRSRTTAPRRRPS